MLGALVAWSLGVVQTLLGDYASMRLDTWVYAWMAACCHRPWEGLPRT